MQEYPEAYDLPAITVLKERRGIVARCEHRCHICGGAIAKGEKYDYFFIKDEESILRRTFSSHQHIFCPTEP